jgi:glycine/D-amino acid oxidase-like deaminating enzyme
VSDSYWLDVDRPETIPAAGGGRVDVAIVGAGITGCSCALTLARAGVHVRVHDARGIAGGASGRNGGFALRGGAARYDVARESYGADAARELWRVTESYLDRLAEVGGDALRRPGSLRLAADDDERAELELEYAALREDGFEAEWRDDLPPVLAPHFCGAIFHPRDGAIQPARMVRRLARAAAGAGATFVQHERVDDIGALAAETVVVATDGSGRGLLPELDDALWPARGQVVATEPLEQTLFPCPHYARQGFDYWQQLPDGRIVAGGFRDFSLLTELTDDEVTTPTIQGALDAFLEELLGTKPRITHRWAGIFGLTQDLLPLVGPLEGREGTWVAAGYSGHGNVLGFMCGDLVAQAILGKPHDLLTLFDPARLARAPVVRESER